MIYVATAHVTSPRWLDVQLRYLRHNMQDPFTVYASLEGFSADRLDGLGRSFDHVGPHAGKLNLLAAEISAVADGGDLIMFLDGDAFPIADPMPVVVDALRRAPVVAMERRENDGDPQPHPAFCVMEVGTWHRIHGDWSGGYPWTGSGGEPRSDVGGNLIRLLELHGTSWTALRRTNTVDLHPVWFGIYGDVVYHHGAGFRSPVSRSDRQSGPTPLPLPPVPGVRRVADYVNSSRAARWEAKRRADAVALSESVFAELEADFEFYRPLVR